MQRAQMLAVHDGLLRQLGEAESLVRRNREIGVEVRVEPFDPANE